MVTASEIRQQLLSFLAKGIDLDDFEDWIAQNTWDVHRSGDLEAEQLAYSIELFLSEQSSGHLSESDLRSELSLLSSPRIEIQPGAWMLESGSSNQVMPDQILAWSLPSQFVGKEGGVVSG